jgi:hypothetical protein
MRLKESGISCIHFICTIIKSAYHQANERAGSKIDWYWIASLHSRRG